MMTKEENTKLLHENRTVFRILCISIESNRIESNCMVWYMRALDSFFLFLKAAK